MTNREICLKAAVRLREVGWQQGGVGHSVGPHCMLGACRWAVGWYTGTATRCDVADADAAAFEATYAAAGGITGVAAWNDEPGRTVEEVIAALEECL